MLTSRNIPLQGLGARKLYPHRNYCVVLRSLAIPLDPVSDVLITMLVVSGYMIQDLVMLPFISIINQDRSRLRKMLCTGISKLTWIMNHAA